MVNMFPITKAIHFLFKINYLGMLFITWKNLNELIKVRDWQNKTTVNSTIEEHAARKMK